MKKLIDTIEEALAGTDYIVEAKDDDSMTISDGEEARTFTVTFEED